MAISDLRNKLKPTPVSQMEQADKDLDQQMGRKSGGGFTDKHSIDAGRNLFRLYPPHEPLDRFGKPNPFAEPIVTTYVPAMVPERDAEGKEIKGSDGKVKMKMGMKPVFNAKIHGKKDSLGNPLTKDAVEEFIKMVIEKSKSIDNEDDKKKFLAPVYGVFISKGHKNNVNQLNYTQKWGIYADKINPQDNSKKFALLEVGKAVKNRINKISALESENEPLGTDPFTDLDEGRALLVKYNPDAGKPEDYYTTEIDSTTEPIQHEGRKISVLKLYPITDEQLEVFAKTKPLATMYREVFKHSDLQIQIKGLKEVDTNYKLGVFETEEFQAVLEELLLQYPMDEDQQNEQPKSDATETDEAAPMTSSTATTTETKPVAEKEGDDFDLMTRAELKEFCKDNQTGIIVKPVSLMSDDQLRDTIRNWMKAQEAGTAESVREEKVEEPLPEELSKHIGEEKHNLGDAEVKPQSIADRLAALKAKAGATNG